LLVNCPFLIYGGCLGKTRSRYSKPLERSSTGFPDRYLLPSPPRYPQRCDYASRARGLEAARTDAAQAILCFKCAEQLARTRAWPSAHHLAPVLVARRSPQAVQGRSNNIPLCLIHDNSFVVLQRSEGFRRYCSAREVDCTLTGVGRVIRVKTAAEL